MENSIFATVMQLKFLELVPYFGQDPVSYLSYPGIKDAYKTFDIDLTFKPQVADGKRNFLD